MLFCFAIIAILQALGCNLLGNNSSKDALPTTVTTILESQNNANSAALIKEVGGLKIEIAANSFNTNYSLKIQKIETEVDSTTANIIKSDLTLSQDLLFVSPIYLLTVTAETGASNLRLSAINDALALTYPASLTIQLNNHTRDRAKYNYYTAWADEDKNWFYEPLSRSDDLTTVVKRLLTLGKYYCVIARDKTSSAEAESLEVSPLALTLVASITEKFEQAPELSVTLGTSAQIDFANSSADLPKLRLIAFTPFDFAPQIKSEQLLPPYYKEVPLSLSNLVSQSGALATFSLSLPLTDITYDPAKHPAALFFDASWLSSSNTAYTSNIACISFGKLTRAAAAIVSPLADAVDVFVTNPVVFSFNKEMNPDSLAAALTIEPATNVTTQYNYVEGSKNELVITPTQNWLYNTDYTITLATSALDINGYALTAQTVLNFSTVVATAPNPNLVSPSNLMSAKLSDNIVIAFETPMATDSVIPDESIWVKKQNTYIYNYDLVWSPEKTLLEIVLPDDLVENASYTIGLDSSIVKSAADIFLTEDKQLTFITERPVPIASIVSPAENATNVFVTNPVVVNFSKQMDPNSLDNALSIVPNTVVTTQYNYVEGSKNELVITPTQNWLYNTAYTVTLYSDMTDTTGLAAPAVSSSFTTVAAATLTANLVTPAVLTDVSSDSAIIIAFNSQVATNTISADNGITIKKDTVTVSDYTLNFSAQDTLLTIEFSQALTEGSTYEITLPASVIKNTYGLPLANDFTVAFTVREPVIVPFTATIVSPLNNAQDIYLNNPVVVDFSKQVDGDYFFQPGIIGNYVVISPAVAFTADYSYTAGIENRLTITPAVQWAANTQYTVTIATHTGDMSHNPLAGSAQVKFTTIEMPPPEIIFSSPLNKDISRQTDKVILSFTKPMDTATFTKGTGVKIRIANFTETHFSNGVEVATTDYELQWSTDNTSCEIVFSDGLETVKAYEITLDSSVITCEDQIHPAETFVGVFRVCPFARGLGTEASPFEIASATDLIYISSHNYFFSRHYKQTEDVDLADYGSSYNGGEGFAPICSLYGGSYFTGVYNGNDKKISNLYINRNSDYQGLFGNIRNAKIHNLFLENVDITTSNVYVGALAGYTTGSEIRDVRVSGEIAGNAGVGGITGYASNYNGLQSQIIRCSAEVAIETANWASDYLGGIVGYLTNSLVSQCFTRVNIEGRFYLGGVVGYSYIAEITDCQSEGRVFGNDSSAYVGGILGMGGSTTISDCISDVYNVTADQKVGGIAGELYNNCAVINCVNNTVTLTGNVDVGRIVGYLNTTTITNCYSREDSTVNDSALTPDTIGISTSGKHGANASFENLTAESWWTGTVGRNLTIWEISPMGIPTLIDVFIPGDFE
ncbi:MAG: The GLUG motif protein [bacterium ADurb.Bin157]|nr:MAG: The GLUG motif protein [bacterium ADurb.Bin157]